MKESTGSMVLMGLAAAIILIFVIIVAFFIKYGITFRIKDQIINRIEQSEGMSKTDLDTYIATKYTGRTPDVCYNRISYTNDYGQSINRGITIKVTIYMSMDSTIFGWKVADIPISGETRIIELGTFATNPDSMSINQCS